MPRNNDIDFSVDNESANLGDASAQTGGAVRPKTLNSGQGGFLIDGKVHIFDTDELDAPGFNPVTSEKAVSVDKTPKDISKKTKVTLANYLGKLTNEAKNEYPIEQSRWRESSITDKEGNPVGPSSMGETPNNPQHSTRSQSRGVTTTSLDLKSSDKRPQEDPASEINNYSTGKANPNFINGNNLLKEVEKNKIPEPLKKYTSAVLKNNRFTSDLPRATAADGFDGRFSDSQFSPNDPKSLIRGNPAAKLQHPQYGAVSLNRLAQVGNSLSLRASTEMSSFNAGNNPTGGAQDAEALLPGWQQLGTSRVDTVLLEAKDILDTLTDAEINQGDLLSINKLSWGSLNNVSDPFSGIQSLGMVALSIALTSALIVVFEGLGGLLSLVSPAEIAPARDMSSGKWQKGKYRTDSEDTSGGILELSATALGIRSTLYPLGDCIQKGVERFFGLIPSDEGGGIGSAVTNAIGAVGGDGLLAPGHNVIICRTIIRSSVTIVDSFKKLAQASSFVSGARDVLEIIDVIRRSKIIAAINIFAQLGDAHLSNLDFVERGKDSAISVNGNHNHRIRENGDRKSESLKLSWASNRAPSLYMIPDSILSLSLAGDKLSAPKGPLALGDEKSKTRFVIQASGDDNSTNSHRIATFGLDVKEDGTGMSVEYFEKVLDSEYVPFYFHDLRTNEIIAFHAFLTSLAENYSPKWESSTGIGRVDPVSVYASTDRKIDISFFVVATSENDFDDMWMKINKLVTLVYPQYTRGRQFENDDGTKFIQPFSQVMSASPLIRLRLGDLFKTNYSKFALARLFGIGSPGSFAYKDEKNNKTKEYSGAQQKIQQFKLEVQKAKLTVGSKFDLSVAGWPAVPSNEMTVGTATKSAPTLNIDAGDLQYFEFEITGLIKNEQFIDCIKFKPVLNPKIIVNGDLDTLQTLNQKYNNPENTNRYILSDSRPEYYMPLSSQAYALTSEEINNIYAEVFKEDIASAELTSKFLDSKENAIVRSFESVKGKGLAGKIDSLVFDWLDRFTWETKAGSTAPQMCKVTLSFSPIHDISPGLDHMGYNRAPIYNVGKTGNGE
jgi:hypothetical protein